MVAACVCECGECVQVNVCVCTSDETESTTYVRQVNTYAGNFRELVYMYNIHVDTQLLSCTW